MRHSYLDNAAILTGQISGIAPTPPVRGKTVKTRIAGLKTQDDFKQKLCVPLIEIEGASYRLRQHADLVPEHVRANASIMPPPPPRRRGRPRKEAAPRD